MPPRYLVPLAVVGTALGYQDTLQTWIDEVTALGYDGAGIMSAYLQAGEELAQGGFLRDGVAQEDDAARRDRLLREAGHARMPVARRLVLDAFDLRGGTQRQRGGQQAAAFHSAGRK